MVFVKKSYMHLYSCNYSYLLAHMFLHINPKNLSPTRQLISPRGQQTKVARSTVPALQSCPFPIPQPNLDTPYATLRQQQMVAGGRRQRDGWAVQRRRLTRLCLRAG